MKSGDLRTAEHLGGTEDIEIAEEPSWIGWAVLDLVISLRHSEGGTNRFLKGTVFLASLYSRPPILHSIANVSSADRDLYRMDCFA